MTLKNKHGNLLELDDIFFDGKIHWIFGFNEPTKEYYLISCEQGYKFGLTQEYISALEPKGTYKGNEKLFVCD